MSDTIYDYSKLWSCVGSAGVVDPADVERVVMIGPVIQLGPGGGAVVGDLAEAAAPPAAPKFQTIQAVVRYGVTPVAGVSTYPEYKNKEIYQLGLRFRIGEGTIGAKLMQVDVLTGAESMLADWSSDLLVEEGADRELWHYSSFEVVLVDAPADFVRNAYYLELTLSAKLPLAEIVLRTPPAVSVIQLLNPKAVQQLEG